MQLVKMELCCFEDLMKYVESMGKIGRIFGWK